MASEKETLESQQKPAMFPPTLSNKISTHPTIDSSVQSNGHQQNLSAKGKLILPTALWILLVIAGLCFISLLSSLNKTLGTLDTLVEIEQKNARFNKAHEHQKGQLKSDGPIIETFDRNSPKELSSLSSMEDSLFKFPRWSALESREQAKLGRGYGKEESVEYLNDLVDSLFRPSAGGRGELIAPAGTVIVASGSNIADRSAFLDNPLESMLNEMMGLGNGAPVANKEADRQKDASPSFVTANIDKINININAQPDEDKKKERTTQKPKSQEPSKEEKMNSLGESIDKLIAKLVEPAPFNDLRSSDSFIIPAPGSKFIPKELSSSRPSYHSHRHRHRYHDQELPSYPTKLLMPMNLAEDRSVQSIFEKHPANSPLLISLNTELGHDDIASTRRPFMSPLGQASNSPYEFFAPDISQQSKQLTNEADLQVAKPKLEDLFQLSDLEQPQSNKSPGSNPEGETIVLINGQPLFGDRKQSSNGIPSQISKFPSPENQMSDLFQMFFGQPPQPFIVPVEITPAPVEPLKVNESTKEEAQDSGSQVRPVVLEKKSSREKEEEGTASTTAPPTSKVTDDIEQFADNLLSNMFALPQMGNDQAPMRVNTSAETKDISSPTSLETSTITTSEPLPTVDSSSHRANKEEIDSFLGLLIPEPSKIPPTSVSSSDSTGDSTRATDPDRSWLKSASTESPSTNLDPDIKTIELTLSNVVDFKPTTGASPPTTAEPNLTSSLNQISSTQSDSDLQIDRASSQSPSTTVPTTIYGSTTNSTIATATSPNSTTIPSKSFWQKADDFIEKNFVRLRKILV